MKILLLLLLCISFNSFAKKGIPSGGGTAILNNTETVAGMVINLSDPKIKKVYVYGQNLGSNRWNTAIHYVSETPVYYRTPTAVTIIAVRINMQTTAGSLLGLSTQHSTVVAADVGVRPAGNIECNDPAQTTNNFRDGGVFTTSGGGPIEYSYSCRMGANRYLTAFHSAPGSSFGGVTYWIRED